MKIEMHAESTAARMSSTFEWVLSLSIMRKSTRYLPRHLPDVCYLTSNVACYFL